MGGIQGLLILDTKCKEHFSVKESIFLGLQKGFAHPLHRGQVFLSLVSKDCLAQQRAQSNACTRRRLTSPSLGWQWGGSSFSWGQLHSLAPAAILESWWLLMGQSWPGSEYQQPWAGVVVVEMHYTETCFFLGTAVVLQHQSVTLLPKLWLLLCPLVTTALG